MWRTRVVRLKLYFKVKSLKQDKITNEQTLSSYVFMFFMHTFTSFLA